MTNLTTHNDNVAQTRSNFRKVAVPAKHEKVLKLKTREKLEEKNDCSVVALSLATKIGYKKVHAALEKAGRAKGKGASVKQMQAALVELGVPHKLRSHSWLMKTFVANYPKPDCRLLANVTTHHAASPLFEDVWADHADRPMVLLTSTHATAWVDGQVNDWAVNRSLRVISAIEICK